MLTSRSRIGSGTNQCAKGKRLDYGFRPKTESDDDKSLSDTTNPDANAGSSMRRSIVSSLYFFPLSL
jgi:hypothetical protein